MRIFVGSSTKQVALRGDGRGIDVDATALKPIGKLVTALRTKGLDVEPWWEDATFQKGRSLLECLIEKARVCDGAIFVVRGDDRLALEAGRPEIGVPRGNVILECGMFLAAKGKEATYIVKDGAYDAISWPTDMLGILLSDLNDVTLADDAHTFFARAKSRDQESTSEVYINDSLFNSVINRKCVEWSTKALYLGAESARRWTRIESGDHYLLSKETLEKFVLHIQRDDSVPIKFEKIDNIISLGPGCGVFDNFIVSKVTKFKPNICYIPIDINPYLAREAATYIRLQNAQVRTPFCIIDDFEEHDKHVDEVIKQRIAGYRQVNVFMMLGGTFSNLEGDEQCIVGKFGKWMGENDYLIVDALIKSDDYVFQNDAEVQVPTINEDYKRFLINACINKCLCAVGGEVSRATQGVVGRMTNDLPDVLVAEEVFQNEGRGRYTQLPGTVVTAYRMRLGSAWARMRKEMLIAKRYKHEELEEFFGGHFNVLYKMSEVNPKTRKGRAMFLLKKKA